MRLLKVCVMAVILSSLTGCVADPHQQFTEGFYNGDFAKINQAVARGANIDVVGDNLHSLVVAIKNNDLALLQLLLEKGANPDYATKAGIYPLHIAAFEGRVQMVKALLEAGAEVNARDAQNSTALHIASMQNQLEISRQLIKAGAELNLEPGDDQLVLNALTLALHNGNQAMVEMMVGAGVQLNFISDYKNHWSVLFETIIGGNEALTLSLLEGEVDVNTTAYDGTTPLHVAVYKNNATLVAKLLDKGAQCHQKGMKAKISPYQLAKQKGFSILMMMMKACHQSA